MREQLVYAAVCLATASAYTWKTFFFKTKVDHFSYWNNDTFELRVVYNTDHFNSKGAGPIFFYAGHQGDIEAIANNTGLLWDWAPEFGALLMFAEHRYYGKSLPYGPKTFSDVKYYGYLTVEQALADYVILLDHVRARLPVPNKSKVVVFGGSYGGMLAAWMRLRYPWIVDAALASSAPIFQFQDFTPCGAYYQILTKTFATAGDVCVRNIRRSWAAFENVSKSQEGLNFIRENFRLCQPVPASNLIPVRDWIYSTYSHLAMMNYPYPTKFLKELPGYPVKVACSYLQNDTADDKALLYNIYRAVNVFYNYSGNVKCNDVGNLDDIGELQGWRVQSCNEMVMPVCSDGVNDMIYPQPWDYERVRKDCETNYKMTPYPNVTKTMFGGMNISMASNILFSNGDIDPWSGGGVNVQLNPNLPVVRIAGGAHHYDLRAAHPNDTPAVIAARSIEKKFIKKWIGMA